MLIIALNQSLNEPLTQRTSGDFWRVWILAGAGSCGSNQRSRRGDHPSDGADLILPF
jgi:hypothetical protein